MNLNLNFDIHNGNIQVSKKTFSLQYLKIMNLFENSNLIFNRIFFFTR